MSKKQPKTAFDYHGVLDEGMKAPDDLIIITGANEEEEGEQIAEAYPDAVIYFFDKHDELTDDNKDIKIAAWKAMMIKKLGIEKYYEDNGAQITILRELSDAEIVPVNEGIAAEPMKFIIFTFDGSILPIAKKLLDEGNEVIVGMVTDSKNTYTNEQISSGSFKKEDAKSKEDRWALYDGILEKHSAEKLLSEMKSLKDKEEYFILSDSNNCFRFCQEALQMGFTNGFFPTEEDRDFEENRIKAKEFVKDNYTDIEVAEVHEYSDIEKAKEFLSDTDKVWVLKSQGDTGNTVCPNTDDCDQAKEQIISALESHQKDYEKDGFILEQYICNAIEVTPEVVFYDGVPVFYSIDIENKPIGAGNIGFQVGCAQNLIMRTEPEDRINKIAFPEIVYDMAKQHKGVFIWDCSILIDPETNKMYFGEFCSCRWGFDSFPTELEMSQSITLFFRKLMKGVNPLDFKYGAAVRIFNLTANEPIRQTEMYLENSEGIYLYDGYEDLSAVGYLDTAVCIGCADDMYEAVNLAYCNEKKITLESKYFRPQFDFLSYEYPNSILRRYNHVVDHGLINPYKENDEERYQNEGAAVPSPHIGK